MENNTMKAMVTYYDAEVLAKMFRTGSIVGASIDEETGCLEFKIMVGERRSEYLLLDEKEMKIMLEARTLPLLRPDAWCCCVTDRRCGANPVSIPDALIFH